jgi:hypothetical protein
MWAVWEGVGLGVGLSVCACVCEGGEGGSLLPDSGSQQSYRNQ